MVAPFEIPEDQTPSSNTDVDLQIFQLKLIKKKRKSF